MSASEAPIDCTPVILTLNEEANLGRALESVSWATDVVVLDSGSKDRTRSIAREYSNVRWFERAFDDFGSQWSFAVTETGIKSTYVLALDADMAVTPDLARELSEVASRRHVSGAVIPFDYRIDGVSLRGSLCRPQLRLFGRDAVRFGTKGHAHAFEVQGPVAMLRNCLIHDDRKPLESFVWAQLRYSEIEAVRVDEGLTKGTVRSLVRRSLPFGPLLAWLAAYVRAGGPLVGHAASRYATERLLYEAMLRYRLDTRALRREHSRHGRKLEEN